MSSILKVSGIIGGWTRIVDLQYSLISFAFFHSSLILFYTFDLRDNLLSKSFGNYLGKRKTFVAIRYLFIVSGKNIQTRIIPKDLYIENNL